MRREDDYPAGYDDPREIDEDVESMAARIAAATVRMDYGFIEDILMDAKLKWMKAGRDAQIDADKRKADHDMLWHRRRRYWFRTLDGLIGEHEIDAEINTHEMIFLAVRHPHSFSPLENNDALKSIPIRRYLWEGERHRDGRPIFVEQE